MLNSIPTMTLCLCQALDSISRREWIVDIIESPWSYSFVVRITCGRVNYAMDVPAFSIRNAGYNDSFWSWLAEAMVDRAEAAERVAEVVPSLIVRRYLMDE